MFMEHSGQQGAWALLLLWSLSLSTADVPWPRSQRRVCTQTLEVNCSSKHLTGVPEGLPGNAKWLDLSANRLKTLSLRQFHHFSKLEEQESIIHMTQVLKNLQFLHIKRNHLRIIPAGVFCGWPNLHSLDVSENEILVFLDCTFQEMGNLMETNDGENYLLFTSHRAFSGLKSLQELNVDRSNLTFIPTEACSHLQSLTKLCRQRLTITVLPSNAFRRLHQLRTLQILQWPSLDTLNSNSLIGLNLSTLVISSCNLSSYVCSLDLSSNPIRSIQRNLHLAGVNLSIEALRSLVYFRILQDSVSSNQLVTLEESTFHSAGMLQTLALDQNLLINNCQLLWMVQDYLRLNFDGQQLLSSTGRLQLLSNGSLEAHYTQAQDLRVAANAAGNDSISASLQVQSVLQNYTTPYFPDEGWVETSVPPSTNSQVSKPKTFDAKILVIAIIMGFLPFLSSVVICFVFIFFWIKYKGPVNHRHH